MHGRTVLEIGWTILPALILAGVAVGTVITILEINKKPEDAIHVEVTGQQWWWQYKYDINNDGNFDGPEDITTATEMVIPAGRDIALTTASNDVIHSFWIPGLNGKKDAVPGITSPLNMQADEPGIFRGQCTEFCGLSHANMRMLVRALPAADYDAWVEEPAQGPRRPARQRRRPGRPQGLGVALRPVPPHQRDQRGQAQGEPAAAGVGRGAQPHPPDDPRHLRRLDLQPLQRRAVDLPRRQQRPGRSAPTRPTSPPPATPVTPSPAGRSTPTTSTGSPWRPGSATPRPMKPMYAQGGRGMPNLGLTEAQIDQLVAFLETLN